MEYLLAFATLCESPLLAFRDLRLGSRSSGLCPRPSPVGTNRVAEGPFQAGQWSSVRDGSRIHFS
jgi:hypothetical protein